MNFYGCEYFPWKDRIYFNENVYHFLVLNLHHYRKAFHVTISEGSSWQTQ